VVVRIDFTDIRAITSHNSTEQFLAGLNIGSGQHTVKRDLFDSLEQTHSL
jgi:hypothetical protein